MLFYLRVTHVSVSSLNLGLFGIVAQSLNKSDGDLHTYYSHTFYSSR